MMFRILTVALMILSGFFFLTDTQHSLAKSRIERFDDKVVLDLLHKKRKAIAQFELEAVKSLYSTDIVTEVVTSEGAVYIGGHNELTGLIDDYARTGLAYDKVLINYAVMVADDGMSAVIRMEAVESWRFEDEFRNISGNLIETQRWVLENGIPKITGIRKEQGVSDPFYLQRREKQLLSGNY